MTNRITIVHLNNLYDESTKTKIQEAWLIAVSENIFLLCLFVCLLLPVHINNNRNIPKYIMYLILTFAPWYMYPAVFTRSLSCSLCVELFRSQLRVPVNSKLMLTQLCSR